jgi:hypothetical protein
MIDGAPHCSDCMRIADFSSHSAAADQRTHDNHSAVDDEVEPVRHISLGYHPGGPSGTRLWQVAIERHTDKGAVLTDCIVAAPNAHAALWIIPARDTSRLAEIVGITVKPAPIDATRQMRLHHTRQPNSERIAA